MYQGWGIMGNQIGCSSEFVQRNGISTVLDRETGLDLSFKTKILKFYL